MRRAWSVTMSRSRSEAKAEAVASAKHCIMNGIIIIGAGQAGATLATELRAQGYDGPVTLIGAEPVAPYERPPLSKGLLGGEVSGEDLRLHAPETYTASRINLRLGQPVGAVDTMAREVIVGQDKIGYDQLALTTGAKAVSLPASVGGGLDGVFTLRTLVDAEALKARLRAGVRLLVVGGGYIGLEVAATAAGLGAMVTLVEMAPRILARVAGPETADIVRSLHRANNVDIREGVGLEYLSGKTRVSAAKLTDGTELAVDCVVAGIGARPETLLAEQAGIACANGIVVDEFGQTSAKGVWAAGDCTSFPYRGDRLRLENVQNAVDQAGMVARNMLGAGKPYRPNPWFWSDQYNMVLQIAGLATGYDRTVTRQAGTARTHWYYSGYDLLAVDALNAPKDYAIAKRLLEMGRNVPPEVAANPDIRLKALLRD